MTENRQAISRWLSDKGIVLEEAFVPALRNYATQFQRVYGYTRLDDVYRIIGTHKSHVCYWESHPHSTQTKNFETTRNSQYCSTS